MSSSPNTPPILLDPPKDQPRGYACCCCRCCCRCGPDSAVTTAGGGSHVFSLNLSFVNGQGQVIKSIVLDGRKPEVRIVVERSVTTSSLNNQGPTVVLPAQAFLLEFDPVDAAAALAVSMAQGQSITQVDVALNPRALGNELRVFNLAYHASASIQLT